MHLRNFLKSDEMPTLKAMSRRRGAGIGETRSKVFTWAMDKILILTISVASLLFVVSMQFFHPGSLRTTQYLVETSNIKHEISNVEYTPIGPRRTKAHICYSRTHGEIGTHVLTSPEYGFNFTQIDAYKQGDIHDWDIMYGGYPHCATIGMNERHRGNSWGFDWQMTHGLNKALEEKGWDNLKPHQVYHPCMGCKLSYCNKREMCRLIRDHVDRDLCFVLPEDLDRLKANMDGLRAWVMKEDGTNVHIHTGSGVTYLTKPEQLPNDEAMSKGVYMVQPWVEPFLGEGIYRRKVELRFYIAITNVYPLRAYIHQKPFVIMAGKRYTTTEEAINDKCMKDTHSSTKECNVHQEKEFSDAIAGSLVQNRAVHFDNYADRVGLSQPKRQKIIEDAHEIILSVIKAGHGELEAHHINKGIDKSGAMCFSHMRVDMGIRNDGKPLIYEISEFPGLYGIDKDASEPLMLYGKDSVEELFRMIGLDTEALPKDQRAQYELEHLGNWAPLE